MKKEEIFLWDIKRILLGQAPPEFLIEVFIRTLIVYIATLVVIRLLGKRMTGQLTIIEMAVFITMGAIISVPMQMADRGILQGLVALTCALAFQRGLNLWTFKNKKVEVLTHGHAKLLVKDGVLQLDELEKSAISKQQVFAELRTKKIFNLGKVKRLYLEACGVFSVYEEKETKPGLPVLPPSDNDLLQVQQAAPEAKIVCINCGTVKGDHKEDNRCPNCEKKEFIKAIV